MEKAKELYNILKAKENYIVSNNFNIEGNMRIGSGLIDLTIRLLGFIIII